MILLLSLGLAVLMFFGATRSRRRQWWRGGAPLGDKTGTWSQLQLRMREVK